MWIPNVPIVDFRRIECNPALEIKFLVIIFQGYELLGLCFPGISLCAAVFAQLKICSPTGR
jgi:hypothetical protein